MNKSEIICKLYEIEAIKLGSFTLKSGITSPIYIDMRQIIGYPKLLQAISEVIWEQAKQLSFDLLCGVPYNALPIATCLSLQHDKPMLIVRKEAKAYGTKKMVEGCYQAGQTCLIIEDVVTTGSSILTVVEELKTVGLQTPYVAAFLDRGAEARATLKQAGCEFFNVTTLTEIITTLQHNGIELPAELMS